MYGYRLMVSSDLVIGIGHVLGNIVPAIKKNSGHNTCSVQKQIKKYFSAEEKLRNQFCCGGKAKR